MRYRRLFILVTMIAMVLGAEWLWLHADSDTGVATPAPPRLSAASIDGAGLLGGDFSLTSHEGQRVKRASFEGRYLLISFGYTACPDVCPLTLGKVADVLEALGPRADRVRALFVTLDPERDSAEVLADYVPHFDPRILGLTGSLSEVEAIARQYQVRFAKAGEGPDYSIDHSAALYLVGPSGRVLRYFRHDITPADLTRMVAAALGDPVIRLTSVKDRAAPAALQFAGPLPKEKKEIP